MMDFDEIDRLKKKSEQKISINKKDKNDEVYIKDINMSFGSMVKLMVKLSFASIPALIIIYIIWLIIGAFLIGLGNSII